MSGLLDDAARRLRSNPGAMCAMFVVAGLVALALFGPWFNPNGSETLDWLHVASQPALQSAHWFGTDRLGRDLFARTLEGTRVSLAVGAVASYLAPAVASIMTGSLVVESIAGLPDIERYMMQGALNRDYTLVMGMVIIYSTLLILMGLVVDLLYAWLDPRVRLGR